jgi:hypothetical protein
VGAYGGVNPDTVVCNVCAGKSIAGAYNTKRGYCALNSTEIGAGVQVGVGVRVEVEVGVGVRVGVEVNVAVDV